MLEKIEACLGAKGKPWTSGATLPGGNFPINGFDDQVTALVRAFPFLELDHAKRLIRLYGTRTTDMLAKAHTSADLGKHFGADLYEIEIRYLWAHEWALTAEDVLWRRTKLGLRLSAAEAQALEKFMTGLRGNSHAQAAE
jgi:glycerol-3-phosphate dehydrogenase